MSEILPSEGAGAARPELRLLPGSSLMDCINIVAHREGVVEAYVPISLIRLEDVPVDEAHVTDLMDSMDLEASDAEGNGQLSPVLLAEVPGEDRFFIVDGFHRTNSLHRRGSEFAYATIRPNTPWERVVDLRILTAVSHKAVKFARIVEWADDAWKLTPWAEQLTAAQGFAVAQGPSKFGMSDTDIRQIKEWALRKSKQWKLSISGVYKDLSVAAHVDPELIRETREGTQGRGVQSALTHKHAEILASSLPDRFDIQRLAAEAIKMRSLSSDEAKVFTKQLSEATDAAAASAFIDTYDWAGLIKLSRRSSTKSQEGTALVPAPLAPQPTRVAEVIPRQGFAKTIFVDNLEVAKLSLENLILRGNFSSLLDSDGRLLRARSSIAQSVWAEREITTAVADLEAIGRKFKDHLIGNSNMSPPQAGTICNRVADRVTAQIREGTLRYVLIRDPKLLTKLFVYMADQELQRLQREGPEASRTLSSRSPTERTLGYILADSAETGDRLTLTLMRTIAELDEGVDRKVLVMSGVMDLPALVIAKAVGMQKEQIIARLDKIAKDVSKRLQTYKYLAEQGLISYNMQTDAEGLNRQDREILSYFQDGLGTSRVAALAQISTESVHAQLREICTKLGVKDKVEAVNRAIELGILSHTA